jgi:hypothetical protein
VSWSPVLDPELGHWLLQIKVGLPEKPPKPMSFPGKRTGKFEIARSQICHYPKSTQFAQTLLITSKMQLCRCAVNFKELRVDGEILPFCNEGCKAP